MDTLEKIRNGIASGRVSLEEVNKALCDGIKQYYGATDLHFFRGYTPGSMTDGYGIIPGGYATYGGPALYSGETWSCSTSSESKYLPVHSPQDLEMLLGDFYNGRVRVYFVDSGRDYDNLHDPRHDQLTMRLSWLL